MARIYTITGVVLLVLAALTGVWTVLLLIISVGFGAGIVGVPEVAVLLVAAALLYGVSRWCGRRLERGVRARAT